MPHIWNDARFSFDIKLYKMSVSSVSRTVYLVFIKTVRMKAVILVMVVVFPGGVLAVVPRV